MGPVQDDSIPTVDPPEDTQTRRLMVVLVDASPSMNLVRPGRPAPIDELNTALRDAFASHDLAARPFGDNGEIAIGAFHSDEVGAHIGWLDLAGAGEHARVRPKSDVCFAKYATWTGSITAPLKGGTPTGVAIAAGLELIRRRQDQWWEEGVTQGTFRPVMLVLTDGTATDDISRAATLVHGLENAGGLALWIAGTSGASREELSRLADKGNFVDLGDRPLSAFVRFMSVSAHRMDGHEPAVDLYRRIVEKWEELESQ
jgi:hypothetical protein